MSKPRVITEKFRWACFWVDEHSPLTVRERQISRAAFVAGFEKARELASSLAATDVTAFDSLGETEVKW